MQLLSYMNCQHNPLTPVNDVTLVPVQQRDSPYKYFYVPAEFIIRIIELSLFDLLEIASPLPLPPFSALMSSILWIYQSLSSVSSIFCSLFMATSKLTDQ